MANYVLCAGCGVAKIPEVKLNEWGGKCPRCQGKQQAERRPSRRPKLRKGHTVCISKGCQAQIPLAKKDEWEGKCPRCQGVEQKSRNRRTDNQFSSLEEFQTAQSE